MKTKQRKQRAVKYGVASIIFCAVSVVTIFAVKASITSNITGWNWGGSDDGAGNSSGVGWISMNSLNCDINNDGKSEGLSSCPVAGAIISSYGVNIPINDGDVTGYAWSENLGWIAFDNSGGYLTGCPAGNGACSARRNGNNLEGWARFTSIADAAGNSGGWQGWIKLNGPGYGVDITKLDGTGSNKMYAWSGAADGTGELGWIDFSWAKLPPKPVVTLNTTHPTPFDVKTVTLPQSVTLSWASTDATSCDAFSDGGTWNVPNIGTTGTKIVSVSIGINENFKVTCHGPGGDGFSSLVNVATACYAQACNSSQICDNNMSNPILGVSDTSKCTPVPPSLCKSNADCTPRSSSNWKEVAP